MKRIIIKIHWLLANQFGFDPLIFLRSLRGLPLFVSDLITFRSRYKGKISLMPCLHDRYEEGGVTRSEYFWQDLLVARAIYESKPYKHVDIGSRIDGFVAHVASYRECEVFDVRPISSLIPGVVFRQADLMNMDSFPIDNSDGYCDSLSCLHALEHFGLGRYGDPINPKGYQLGVANMSKLLKVGGILYLSTPIGEERVEFNANWVFDPQSIVECARLNKLILKRLIVISVAQGAQESEIDSITLSLLASNDYQLGLFIFEKEQNLSH